MKANIEHDQTRPVKNFSTLRLVTGVLIMLLLISFSATWYARQVSIPRYCDNPQQVIIYLQDILYKKLPEPEKLESKRPYIIAAKLLFLIPQLADESTPDYLQRVTLRLQEQCQ